MERKTASTPAFSDKDITFGENLSSIFEHNIDLVGRRIFLGTVHDDEDGTESGIDANINSLLLKQVALLEQLNPYAEITFMLSGFGGCVEYALGLYDRIRASPCATIARCYGPVQSAHSLVLQACDRRLLAPHSVVMLHYARDSIELSSGDDGGSKMEEHKRTNRLMLKLYIDRIKRAGKQVDKNKFHQQLKDTLYLTAPQAVAMGLADGIITKA